MIGTRSAAVVAAIVAMAFLGCAGRDIDKLCPIAEAVKNDESLSPELKHAVFVRRGKGEVSSTAAKNVLDPLGAVSATTQSSSGASLAPAMAAIGPMARTTALTVRGEACSNCSVISMLAPTSSGA